jgi:hypothetical protein
VKSANPAALLPAYAHSDRLQRSDAGGTATADAVDLFKDREPDRPQRALRGVNTSDGTTSLSPDWQRRRSAADPLPTRKATNIWN